MKKNILVTGASGFIGSHVADHLTTLGHSVKLFDIRKSIYLKKKQKMILGNVNNLNHLYKASKNIHTIFHFAATADLNEANEKPFVTIENNITSTVKLLKACIKNNVKKIIFASSIYAISEQGGIYSTSKLSSEMIIEKICKKFKIKYVILRFGTVYGERANRFNTVQNFINEGNKNYKIFRNTRGNEVRSYIHVKDVTKIVAESDKKKYENGHYNIFGNKKTFFKKLLNIIKSKIPNLKVFYSKFDKKKYNYKINPFTYKLRKGKIIKLKRYINLENGIATLINK